MRTPKPPTSTIQRNVTNSLRQAYRQAKLVEQALEKADKHSSQKELFMTFLLQAKDANQKAMAAITDAGVMLRQLEG